MDGARDQFFASSSLADDQDARARGRDLARDPRDVT